jgi:hypothetical protein
MEILPVLKVTLQLSSWGKIRVEKEIKIKKSVFIFFYYFQFLVDLIYEFRYNQTINKIITVDLRLLFALLLIIGYESVSQAQMMAGAKQISIANSGVALSNDVFAIFNNPAGLAQFNWRELGVFYSPAPFGFKELSNACIAYVEPLPNSSLSFGAMTYGFELYKENRILLGYSYKIFNNFFLGLALNYHSVSIKNYGNKSVFYFNLGGLTYITTDIRWGFFIYNINRTSFVDEDDQIPAVFNSGFSYNIISELSLNLAVEKDVRYNASIRFGIDYCIIENLSLRTGFSGEPSAFSAGIGINYSFINLDYAVVNHPDLGLTHQAGLIISFQKNGNRYKKIKDYLSGK